METLITVTTISFRVGNLLIRFVYVDNTYIVFIGNLNNLFLLPLKFQTKQ